MGEVLYLTILASFANRFRLGSRIPRASTKPNLTKIGTESLLDVVIASAVLELMLPDCPVLQSIGTIQSAIRNSLLALTIS